MPKIFKSFVREQLYFEVKSSFTFGKKHIKIDLNDLIDFTLFIAIIIIFIQEFYLHCCFTELQLVILS